MLLMLLFLAFTNSPALENVFFNAFPKLRTSKIAGRLEGARIVGLIILQNRKNGKARKVWESYHGNQKGGFSMDTKDAIAARRSIRSFKPDPVERRVVEELLELAVQAPSAKNDQPWRFVVTEGQSKERLVETLQQALEEVESQGQSTGSMRGSLQAMAEAPLVILVFNRMSRRHLPQPYQYVKLLVDTQSLGAVIQTFLLAAQDMGLGTLWICDVLFGTGPVQEFAGCTDELVAAIALGVPAESPQKRPRLAWQELTAWME
jgi:nitroreductase